jgi:hypothetical protein
VINQVFSNHLHWRLLLFKVIPYGPQPSSSWSLEDLFSRVSWFWYGYAHPWFSSSLAKKLASSGESQGLTFGWKTST